MPQQLSLLGIPPERATIDRLFIGLFPDLETAAHIESLAFRLRANHGLRGRPFAKDRFHVTLLWIGDYAGLPTATVRNVSDAVSAIDARSFEMTFDLAGSFGNSREQKPLVLQTADPAAPVKAFQQELRSAVLKAGVVPRQAKDFSPHLTLLYDKHLLPLEAIEPIRWQARELVLVHSLIGQTRYIPLARWPLIS